MKRDMDLARRILEQVEEKSQGTGGVVLDIPEFADEAVSYHIMLLKEAGLLDAEVRKTDIGIILAIPRRLTWNGHEFLDAIRNDTVWNKVKEIVKEKGGAIPFELLKGLALKVAASVFGLG